jgi:hypothetical protein
VVVAFYSDNHCSDYIGFYDVPDEQDCFQYVPDSYMTSARMKCVNGTQPEIDTNSTVTRCVS